MLGFSRQQAHDENGFHQHLNVSTEAIWYVVLRRGNPERNGGGPGRAHNPQIDFLRLGPAV